MQSRERVLASLSHREPDRVPIDLGSHRSSGMSAQAYRRLREHLGLPTGNTYIYDVLQQLAIIEDDVLDRLGIDIVQLGYDYYRKQDYWKEWVHDDGQMYLIPSFIEISRNEDGHYSIRGDFEQEIAVMKRGCLYFEQTYYPYMDREEHEFDDLEFQLNQIMWCRVGVPPQPHAFDRKGMAARRQEAMALRKRTDRAIYGTFGGNLYETGQQAFGMENFLCDMVANPERIERFLDALLEIHMTNLKHFLDACGDCIDVIGFGDDLGMQTGPQFSIEMFCRFFKPRYRKMWHYVKCRFPGLKICMHSCGGIYPFLPHLIDAGLDCVNPVQTTCKDMNPSVLKDAFGDSIVFWGGGCDTRRILPVGSSHEIREDVRKNMEAFKPQGGFVFQQVHNILANVPPENVSAMLDAAIEYGRYS